MSTERKGKKGAGLYFLPLAVSAPIVAVMVLAVLNALRALSVDKGGVVLMEAPKPAVPVAA